MVYGGKSSGGIRKSISIILAYDESAYPRGEEEGVARHGGRKAKPET